MRWFHSCFQLCECKVSETVWECLHVVACCWSKCMIWDIPCTCAVSQQLDVHVFVWSHTYKKTNAVLSWWHGISLAGERSMLASPLWVLHVESGNGGVCWSWMTRSVTSLWCLLKICHLELVQVGCQITQLTFIGSWKIWSLSSHNLRYNVVTCLAKGSGFSVQIYSCDLKWLL